MQVAKNPIDQLEDVIKAFDGFEREFCIHRKDGSFSKRFMVKDLDHLKANIAYHNFGQPFEIHFSVQRISLPSRKPFTWTLVLDLDGSRKGTNANNLKKLLNKFGVIYLVDSRLHLWLPDWQTCLIPNWNNLFGDKDNFVLPLKYYLEKMAKFNSCSLDEQLWNTQRHPIRMPYSPHHPTSSTQNFLNNREEALSIWDGTYFDSDSSEFDTYHYAKNFKTFIETAMEYGKEIVQALGKEVKIQDYNYASKSGEIRPCFKAAIATHHMRNMVRLALVSEARSIGMKIEEIIDLFRSQNDFVEETTKYQVTYQLKKKGYRWRCSTIERHGFCLLSKCDLYNGDKA